MKLAGASKHDEAFTRRSVISSSISYSSRMLRRRNNAHGHVRMVQNIVADAAQERASKHALTTTTHHNQLRLFLLRRRHDVGPRRLRSYAQHVLAFDTDRSQSLAKRVPVGFGVLGRFLELLLKHLVGHRCDESAVQGDEVLLSFKHLQQSDVIARSTEVVDVEFKGAFAMFTAIHTDQNASTALG